jgi:hypothetical protein
MNLAFLLGIWGNQHLTHRPDPPEALEKKRQALLVVGWVSRYLAVMPKWEIDTGKRVAIVDVNETQVMVGSNCGPDGGMVGSVVSHAEFIEGRYQDVVKKVFGEDVLQEMLVACSAGSEAASIDA